MRSIVPKIRVSPWNCDGALRFVLIIVFSGLVCLTALSLVASANFGPFWRVLMTCLVIGAGMRTSLRRPVTIQSLPRTETWWRVSTMAGYDDA